MKIIQFCIFSALLAVISPAISQKTSFSLGIGTCYYLGDMQQTMTDMRPGVHFQYKWNFYQGLSVRASVLHTAYGANDANSSENKSRGLKFQSPLSEATLQLVYEFLPQTLNHNGRDWVSRHKFSPYVFIGGGGCAINPYVQGETKIRLQPFGTEGQFIMRGNTYPKPYKLMQFVVPAGIGASFRINRNLGLGFDVGYRYTFTDYLDDVSGLYPNKNDLKAFSGGVAVLYSDPTRNHEAGQARGNAKNRDSYFFGSFSFTYFLLNKECPK
jgi:hypothetical protein